MNTPLSAPFASRVPRILHCFFFRLPSPGSYFVWIIPFPGLMFLIFVFFGYSCLIFRQGFVRQVWISVSDCLIFQFGFFLVAFFLFDLEILFHTGYQFTVKFVSKLSIISTSTILFQWVYIFYVQPPTYEIEE